MSDNKAPERIVAWPEMRFGQFAEEIDIAPWCEKGKEEWNGGTEYIRADLVEAGVELWDQISRVLTDLDFRWGDFYEVSPRDAVEHIEEAISGLEQIIERQDKEIARLKEKLE